MNKAVKYIIGFVVVIFVGYFIYIMMNKKMMYAKTIAKAHHQYWRVYMTMDEPYLKEWAAAVKSKQQTFTYAGAFYVTETGKKL